MPANYYTGPLNSGGFSVAPAARGDDTVAQTLGRLANAGVDLATYDPATDPKAQEARYYGAKAGESANTLQQQQSLQGLVRSHAQALREAANSPDPNAFKGAIQDTAIDALNNGITDSKSLAGIGETIASFFPGKADDVATSLFAPAHGKALDKDQSVTPGRQDLLRSQDFNQQTSIANARNTTDTTIAAGNNASAERRTAAEVAGRAEVEGAKLAAEPKKPLIVPAGATATTPTGGVIYAAPDHSARLKDQTDLAEKIPSTIAGYLPGGIDPRTGAISDDPGVQNVIRFATPLVSKYAAAGEPVASAVSHALSDVTTTTTDNGFLGLGSPHARIGVKPELLTPGAAAPVPASSTPAASTISQIVTRQMGARPPAPPAASTGPALPSAPSAAAGAPPVPGAQQAPDGHWYVRGPNGYLRVDQ